ncbi:hypothetical protein EJB05_38259, partial [Eragrostis curvula]
MMKPLHHPGLSPRRPHYCLRRAVHVRHPREDRRPRRRRHGLPHLAAGERRQRPDAGDPQPESVGRHVGRPRLLRARQPGPVPGHGHLPPGPALRIWWPDRGPLAFGGPVRLHRLHRLRAGPACLSGGPCKMLLTSDGQGHKPGWYVSYVQVTQLGQGSVTSRAHRWRVEQWLAVDEAPRQLSALRNDCGFAAAETRP